MTMTNTSNNGAGGGGSSNIADIMFTDNTGAQFIYRDNGASPPVFTAYLVPAGTAYTVGANPRPYAVRDVNAALTTLISGEDQVRNVMKTINGAQQYGVVLPLPSAATAGVMPRSDVICGSGAGSAGDYLGSLSIMVNSQVNAAVYIRDGAVADIASGTTGTNPAGTTALAVTASVAQTWTANQYAGSIVRVVYTPTGGASTTIKRKIVANPVVSASTSVSFTLSHAIPAGASITAWGLEPASSWEVLPYNALIGIYPIQLGKASVYGGWKISVDSGAQVEYGGIFN